MSRSADRGTGKRYVYKLMRLSGRDAHAGRHRRRSCRHPVGKRSPEPCASEHRDRGQQPSRARRDRAPARRVLCRAAEGVLVEAGRRRDAISTQGVERAPDDPVRRDAIVRKIARQIGSPDAVRAVGAANGRNPVSIVTPCHRVIGATGKLTGFGGGLDAKARLLALEGATLLVD